MNKRRYQSTAVNQVDWAALGQAASGRTVTFSVDVAKTNFMADWMLPGYETVQIIRWCHPQETPLLVAGLRRLVPTVRIEVVMEPSGTYGDSLRYTLGQLGLPIYRVAPQRVHDAAEVFDGVPSLHDAKSAYLIGRLHQEGASTPWQELSAERRDAQALLAELDLHREEQQRNHHRLAAELARHWPEAEGIIGLDGVSLLSLMATYGDPYTLSQQRSAAHDLLRRTGGPLLKAEVIEGLLDSAAQTLGQPCTRAERAYLQCLAEELLRAHRAIAEVERRIARQVEASPENQRLADTLGIVTALALFGLLGSPRDYPSVHHYLKALGLNLKGHSSGAHHGPLHITKRGPSRARQYLYFAVLRWLPNPLVQTWYQAKSARDGGIHGNALISLMRRLAKGIWHVARGAAFDTRKLFDPRLGEPAHGAEAH